MQDFRLHFGLKHHPMKCAGCGFKTQSREAMDRHNIQEHEGIGLESERETTKRALRKHPLFRGR